MPARLEAAASWDSADAVVVVTDALDNTPEDVRSSVLAAAQLDATLSSSVSFLIHEEVPGQRMVISPTGRLDRPWDDVRRIAEAAAAGIRRARDAGAKRPFLEISPLEGDARYTHAVPVAVLGALEGLWEPLEAREAHGEEVEPIEAVLAHISPTTHRWVSAVETGTRLARDLCGTQPERMTPIAFADYCVAAFADTDVEVEVKDDLLASYPLLSAVARASTPVPRHHPRVVRLVWEGEGPIEQTVLLAGKGVTYDTGGADLKTGGHMAGMSRDKGGAAAVAGFVKAIAGIAPKGLRVVAELGLVRNDIGSEAFVTDEIITGHSGCRVRIGNTDAEGRLVLADLLSHLREDAATSPSPHVFSCATLTGHSVIAAGPYSIALDNGAACGMAESLARTGDAWGDPFEISRLRREDVAFVAPRTRADDVISCNNKPSSATPRGHQFPAAFLAIASGLADRDVPSEHPIPFTHLDIGGSGVEDLDWQHGAPTGRPVRALCARFAPLVD